MSTAKKLLINILSSVGFIQKHKTEPSPIGVTKEVDVSKKTAVLGHWVQFSEETARINSEMILREYAFMIKQKRQEIEDMKISLRDTFIEVTIATGRNDQVGVDLSRQLHFKPVPDSYHEYESGKGHYYLKVREVWDCNLSRSEPVLIIDTLKISPSLIQSYQERRKQIETQIAALEQDLIGIEDELSWFILRFRKL